ncbi:ECF transporter S component [Leuconostoc fallax]|uniref:ECF transporter S component n=1 Tax=Leuconostoc fallax TaxID=1251 RepID=A0A4R5NA23_9LACO|nr:ECF transporter S component [Leuconostoc fallax]MBU7456224.1 ECF transporter S component [Leuconostoc fallax]MCO6184462.1 ECF transporter S component [Leuconostoc fallax]TDG69049.1 hypothetical protein C5L23_001180 [Leuconostoc fallax]
MKNRKTIYLMITTFFMAIVLVQSIISWLGYLPLGAFVVGAAPTIVQFTVAIGAILVGPKYGAVLGGFWGLTTLYIAWTTPGSIGSLMFQNPFTALLPRVAVGLLIGFIYQRYFKNQHVGKQTVGLASLGVLAALINTVGVVILTTIGFSIMQTNFTGIPTHNILGWLIGIVWFNGIFEVITGAILVPLIAGALIPIAKRLNI